MNRLVGILSVYLRRWWVRFQLLPALLILIAFCVVIATSIAPSMKLPGRSWFSTSSWKNAARETGIVVACALYLRYEEKFRKFISSRGVNHAWKVRMADLSRIIDELFALDLKKTGEVYRIRKEILKCIVSGVSETLDLPSETLCANLLDLDGPHKDEMVVSARSDSLRNTGIKYQAVNAFLPWKAIKDASMEVEDNYHEREGIGPRKYKSVVAIPVTKGGRAHGCLSIDCTIPYAFNGRKLPIYYQIRPYIALLALTYGPSSVYHDCAFNPAHIG